MCEACGRNGGVFWRKGPFSLTPARVRWERGRHRPVPALKGRPMKARGEAPGLGVHANISSPARVTHAGAHPNAFAGGLSRPFRAVRIDFGLDTRGVAPGYHSAPFQGCPGLSVP